MSPQAIYVLVLFVAALLLFATEIVRVDVAALILLLALTIPGVLEPGEALAGFGSDTILVLISLFVLTAGVIKTGVVERIGLRLASLGSTHPLAFTRFLLVACTSVSSFISNTVTAAVFLPIVIGAAKRARLPASKLLMPMAFASILASGVSVIATSTNLVVAGVMPKYGLAPLRFFELTPVGLVVVGVGMLYLIFVAPRLIPDREEQHEAGTAAEGGNGGRTYVTEVVVPPRSTLVGKTLAQLHLPELLDLFVVGIRRGTHRILHPWPGAELREGDELVVEGKAEDILSVKDLAGLDIKPDLEQPIADAASAEHRMIEAMVLPRSRYVGRTLREVDFHRRTGLAVLAIHTAGERAGVRNLSRWRMKPSDVLLLQGREQDVDRLPASDLILLEDLSAHHPRSPRGRVAALIFVVSIVLGAAKVLPLPVAFLLGVVMLVLTRCLTADEAYAAVDWRMMVLIGSMMAFGTAMQKTGAASWLAAHVVDLVGPFGRYTVVVAFSVLTILLTQPMSNQAAALVVLPIAVEAAGKLGIDVRTIVIAVTLSASLSFLTPLEPACLLVYGPGRYRFFDFMRVGLPLTVITVVITMSMIPLLWPIAAS
jgi:di/tricarboxylate transporter